MTRRVIIVGGGIAGLATAWQLARRGVDHVILFERERLLCSHASGNNAAIFRPLEEDPLLVQLALRSRQLFDELSPAEPLVDARGLLLLHDAASGLEPTARVAKRHGVACRTLGPAGVRELLAGVGGGASHHGLYSEVGGVIDIHALSAGLASACRALGVTIRTGTSVGRLIVETGRLAGVRTFEGEFESDDLVLAAGAWQASLGASVDCGLPLIPVRRHLALVKPTRPIRSELPAVWKLGNEVYFRREGDNLLASPCDETVWSADVPQAELSALAPLSDKLAQVDPELGMGSVARFWACLRTFAPDRRPVVGADPRLAGLYWMAGFGGFGMSTSLAAAELLADALLTGREAPAVSPRRLCTLARDTRQK